MNRLWKLYSERELVLAEFGECVCVGSSVFSTKIQSALFKYKRWIPAYPPEPTIYLFGEYVT